MGDEGASIDQIAERASDGFSKLIEGISVDDLFGSPTKVGDRVVITAASIERVGGFGFGGGFDESSGGSGGGGGGGGKAEGRAIAVIDIGPYGVQVRPVIDVTRLGVTALLALISLLRRR